jgi:hypothetical protein
VPCIHPTSRFTIPELQLRPVGHPGGLRGWSLSWEVRGNVLVDHVSRSRVCPCLGLALARGTPRGQRMDGYHEGKRVREDKRLEGSVCDGPGLPVRGRDRGTWRGTPRNTAPRTANASPRSGTSPVLGVFPVRWPATLAKSGRLARLFGRSPRQREGRV